MDRQDGRRCGRGRPSSKVAAAQAHYAASRPAQAADLDNNAGLIAPATPTNGPAPATRPPGPADDGSGPDPVPVLPPQRDHPHLHLRRHLMRTPPRPATAVDQTRQPTTSRIPARPLMHRLPGHPIPARHHRHRCAVQHLEDRPIPLLAHAQLHQHRSPPRPRPRRSRREESPHQTRHRHPPTGTAVAHQSEPRPDTVTQQPVPR